MAEITDRESLQAWLRDKPREVAVVIASRVALRVAPLAFRGQDAVGLLTFRAAAVASLMGRWPHLATQLRAHAEAAASVADEIASFAVQQVNNAHGEDLPGTIVAGADYSAAYAARAAAYAARVAADAARTAAPAAAADAAKAADAGAAAVWDAVRRDADFLIVSGSGASPAGLSDQPLWHADMPAWAADAWARLKIILLAANEGWEVWTGWYEDRLAGRFGPEQLEFARATVPDEDWVKGSAHLNGIVAAQIEEHTATKFPSAEILTVSIATGKIGLVPPEITGKELYEQTCERVLHGLGQFSSTELTNQYAAARDVLDGLDNVLRHHRQTALLVHARIVGARKELARLVASDELPANDFKLMTLRTDLADAQLDIEDAVPLVRAAVERRAKERMRAPDAQLLEELKDAADKLIEAADEGAALLAGEGSAALDRVAPGQRIQDEADNHAIYTLGWMMFRVPRLRRHLAKIAAGAVGVAALHQALIAAEALYLRLHHLFY